MAGIVVQHLTVARVAEGLGVSWDCANTSVLEEGRRVLINDECVPSSWAPHFRMGKFPTSGVWC